MKAVVSYIFCILLSLSLNTFIRAQTQPAEAAKPSPLKGPLSLSVKSIDETEPSHRTVHYTIRNNTDKPVRASVFRVEKHPGGDLTLTSYYGRFAGNGVHESVFRVDGKYQTTISVEIDFVLFEDGSTWGSDSMKRSGNVLAYYKGKDAAFDHFKQLFEASGGLRMNKIFATELSNPEPPELPAEMDQRRKLAFLSGYRSMVLTFKRDFEARGVQGIVERLKKPDSF